MRSKMPFRLLVIAALFTVIISLAVTTPGVSGDGDEDQYPIPEKSQLTYPNLGSALDRMAARVDEGEATAREAAKESPVHREESVAVTIYMSGDVDGVVSFLEDNGGSPRNVGGDYIEAYVPVSLLGQVSEQTGVLRVREIIPEKPAQSAPLIAGHGPQVQGSMPWNQAGYSGQGIKVGVIDLGFADFRSLMGTELPDNVQAKCYTDLGVFTQTLADCESARGGDPHGTAVAEAVMDIAPEVSLYIATPSPGSKGDLRAIVDWMVSEGVSVINHSAGWPLDGPGDGTSPLSVSPLNTIDHAVANDIIWVNAMSNDAQRAWFQRGPYSDSDEDYFIEFAGSDENNTMLLEVGDVVQVELRWDDIWRGASRDLDLAIWSQSTEEYVTFGVDYQSGDAGHNPYELVIYEAPVAGQYDIRVEHAGGDVPGWIQLLVQGVGPIEHYTSSGSTFNPEESANPGMLAVGAAPWYNVHAIEPYSGRGPTTDGRVKPDIVGADCGETALIPLNENDDGFCGTSQSAPHVAGMAALVGQRLPELSPVDVAWFLKREAAQRGTPRPNNTWGHGFAKLPAVDRAALEALYNATGGANWANNENWLSTAVPIGLWYGVTTDVSGRVTALDLSENQLTGPIPPGLGSLANLEELRLRDNQLTGPIPTELVNLTNLEGLHLTRNQLTGPIPSELGILANLRELALGGNQLTGHVPTQLGSLTNLQELYLWDNELNGEIPAELGNLTDLTVLELGGNELTGPIPTELGSLTNLEELNLTRNQLTGVIPTQSGRLTYLAVLALGGNQLIGHIPSELGSLTNLQELYLWGNQLTGPIPSELGSLTNLEQLHLSENQLIGPIPTELGSLANLQELYLWGNELTGTIPSWLGSLTSLTTLSLHDNQLTGTIPSWLGSLTSLEFLSLRDNQLSGTIPVELGNLTNLTTLSLSANQLTGQIPAELGRLDKLEELHLSENQLIGCIPATLRNVLTNDLAELGLPFCVTSLVARYDDNNNGTIEKSEVIAAINDYLFGEGDEAISKAEVIKLINLYLFG